MDREQINSYDSIIVCMSGGKDSIASLLHLFDLGADRSRIELWHHDVDGREGSTLMDWPCMADYCRALAQSFGLPIYYSWLEHGFEGEMLKENSISHPHKVETPDGTVTLSRDAKRAKAATRLKFPQVAASLATRWCSSALKIDVGRRALNNQERFNHKRTLFITGERREESSNRAKYNELERHACDRRDGRLGRHVDAWRPVIDWLEPQVWEALERYCIVPPVPYRLGWGRASCMKCIFNDAEIWATLQKYFPGSLSDIAEYESLFGSTISRTKKSVLELAKGAKPLQIDDSEALLQAMSKAYTLPVLCEPGEWFLPAGAGAKVGCGAL